ncbi:DUF2357 domain-containing protein [Neobacillus bataviensis]|uniref:DUF2357 domain-containing protein n=1 Tax=Neobacillus bataviensis TaxID=220685 RepID=UPI001CBA8D45|nr:DUF2357 domain-containing protein [Neobacillus bataviensis]
MKVELVNDFGNCEELPLKSKAFQLTTFLNYLRVVPKSYQVEDILINGDTYECNLVENVLIIPCYFNLENSCTIQIVYNEQILRYSFKYVPSLIVEKNTIESLADFYRRTSEWLGEGVCSVDLLIDGINSGHLNLLHLLDPLTGMDDQSVLDEIMKALPLALNICSRPRQHLKVDEEILDVELVKRINPAALQHLSSHSEHWRARTITGLVPSRLRAEIYEDDINIYENTFFKMAMDKILKYISIKDEELKLAIAQSNTLVDWERYGQIINDYKRAEILYKLLPKFDFDSEEEKKKQYQQLKNKIDKLAKQISSIVSTRFYQSIDKFKILELPIQPTNILKMDNRYNEIFKLWNKLLTLEIKEKTQEELTGATIPDINRYYVMYVQTVLVYSFHLMGYQFNSESFIEIEDAKSKMIAKFGDSRFEIHCSTETKNQFFDQISIRIIEKLNHEVIIPAGCDISEHLMEFKDICEISSSDLSILRFKKKPTKQIEKQLSHIFKDEQLVKKALTKEAKKELDQMDKIWRKFLSNELIKLKEPRSYTINIYPILNSIGIDEIDLKRFTKTLLDGGLQGQETENVSNIFVLPMDIYKFGNVQDHKLINRLINYGEAYDMDDASTWGNYQVGLLPISQTEINSTQRFIKLLSLHLNRLAIKWGISDEMCPTCGSSHTQQIDPSTWVCKSSDCGVLWGVTKCSNGCEEEYEWIRPSLDLSHIAINKGENPLQQKLDKESLFNRLTITDFNIFLENKVVKYVPKCPRCGSSSEPAKVDAQEMLSI